MEKYIDPSIPDLYGCLWKNCKLKTKVNIKHKHGLLSHIGQHLNIYRFNCPIPDCKYVNVSKSYVVLHFKRNHL